MALQPAQRQDCGYWLFPLNHFAAGTKKTVPALPVWLGPAARMYLPRCCEESPVTAALDVAIVLRPAAEFVIAAVVDGKAEVTAAFGQGVIGNAGGSVTLTIAFIHVIAV